ncbi:hypothetical protein HG531_001661 [Fusarium graminearum]|nr:hypothetical protein HG531_001661 [Fusarium graminearum]
MNALPHIVSTNDTHLALNTRHLREILPGAVDAGEVEAGVALPETLAGLSLGPALDLAKKIVVVTGITHIHLPLPEVVVLGVLVGKVLHGHRKTAVHSMNGQVRATREVVVDALVESEHLSLRPQGHKAAELFGNRLFNTFLVDSFVCPNRMSGFILDLDQQMDVITTTRSDGKLSNERSKVGNVIFAPVVLVPAAHNDSCS